MAARSVTPGARLEIDSLPADNQPAKIRLPRSASRLRHPYVFCRIVQEVKPTPFQTGLEGPIFAPGALVDPGNFRSPALVVECCGPVGPGVRGRAREVLWILWALESDGWRELARASAVNWEWALTLKPIAERLLHPPPGLHDVLARSQAIARESVDLIAERIYREAVQVQKHVWASLYDQAAGRIVEE